MGEKKVKPFSSWSKTLSTVSFFWNWIELFLGLSSSLEWVVPWVEEFLGLSSSLGWVIPWSCSLDWEVNCKKEKVLVSCLNPILRYHLSRSRCLSIFLSSLTHNFLLTGPLTTGPFDTIFQSFLWSSSSYSRYF